ncbi:MAG TPA: hypothetical protein VF796_09520 [Humisphaera sp.]
MRHVELWLVLASTIALWAAGGCGSLGAAAAAGEPTGPREPPYGLGVYNATAAPLTEVAVTRTLEGGRVRVETHGVVSPGRSSSNHFVPGAIPARATLSWRTPDGARHEREVAVAERVPDPARFEGTVWFRVGPGGEVTVVPISDAERDARAARQQPITPD